jgi:hypothetical protein
MDKPIPWIFLLVGVAFFEGAVSDYREKKYRGALTFTGLALTSFVVTVIWAEVNNPSALLSLLRPQPLLPYGLIALLVSLIASLAWSYHHNVWNVGDYLRSAFLNLAIAAALWLALFIINAASPVLQPQGIPTPETKYYPLPLTMRNLFDNRFPIYECRFRNHFDAKG